MSNKILDLTLHTLTLSIALSFIIYTGTFSDLPTWIALVCVPLMGIVIGLALYEINVILDPSPKPVQVTPKEIVQQLKTPPTTAKLRIMHLVQVTQEDIDKGLAKHCTECPTARAMRRTFPKSFTSSEYSSFWVYDGKDLQHFVYPTHLANWIRAFDHGQKCKPISFHVPHPNQWS